MSQALRKEGRGAKRWCFTWNNPDKNAAEFMEGMNSSTIRYCVFQLEKGAEGTPHYQGYVELSRNCRYPARDAAMGMTEKGAHWEYCYASAQANIDYCTKEESRVSGPWHFGTPGPTGPGAGARTDLEELYAACQATKDPAAVMKLHPVAYMKYHSAVAKVCYNLTEERREAPLVRLFYGPSGTGKTREAVTTYGEASVYIKDPHQEWYCGYAHQPTLILDEFAGRASKTPLTLLLRILDLNKLNLPVKGAQVKMTSTTVIITTNIHPSNWYDYTGRPGQYLALQRRIHEVRYFPTNAPSYIVTPYSFFDSWYDNCDENEVLKAGTLDDITRVAQMDPRRVGSARDLPIELDGPEPKARVIKTEPVSDEDTFDTPPAWQDVDALLELDADSDGYPPPPRKRRRVDLRRASAHIPMVRPDDDSDDSDEDVVFPDAAEYSHPDAE